jgi:hypothetical protein
MKKKLKVHSVEMLVRRLDTSKNNDPAGGDGFATFSAGGFATFSASGLASVSASGLASISASGLAII